MSVTLRGVTLYSASEVSAMTPTGTIDSQWETYFLDGKNGWDDSIYNLGKFHVNKITGLVTGEIGISNRTATNATSMNYGSNANLGIHSEMVIKYPGAFEYLTTKGSPTAAQILNGRELNTTISTTGDFTLQGRGWSTATIPNISNFLETFAYIGSKYGKIYTQEYNPIYLKEGAFYRQEQVDLITGHAWLKIPVTLPTGYNSNSHAWVFKNLWSGECIFQYSLYPTTAGTMPAITLPTRCAVYNHLHFYTDIRYCDPATTYANRHSCYMRMEDYAVKFNPIISQAWATGSLYYQGNVETPTQGNGTETVVGLWLPESAEAIPSVNNARFPRNKSGNMNYTITDSYLPTSKFAPRSTDPSWTTNNYRSGMVFFYWDMNMKAGTMPSPFIGSSEWAAYWIPSYRYNITSGTQTSLYCNGVQYLSNLNSSYATTNSAWTCNIYARSGKALGADPGTGTKFWNFGATGEMTSATAGLACFNGYYLSNNSGNIIQ